MQKIIYFTVTNDLSYDQRMHKICGSLANAGFKIILVGRKLKSSLPLINKKFQQKRLACIFNSGKLFYAEYNLRLFFFLLFKKMDGICAIDLDTILPVYYISKIKKAIRIYDAHELFCEMKEVMSRPKIYKFWKKIEAFTLPHFKNAYTVNEAIAKEFKKMYGINYAVIRNVAVYNPMVPPPPKENFILYQGAVNEGRCFEDLIPAMADVELPLYIYGKGNFMQQAKAMVDTLHLHDKVFFKGLLPPEELKEVTAKALLGINLVENNGLSYYLSLSNRFFDYLQAGTAQICMNFPAYRQLNDEYKVAIALDDDSSENIALQLNQLIKDTELRHEIEANCKKAALVLNWQNEEKILINFYRNLFG